MFLNMANKVQRNKKQPYWLKVCPAWESLYSGVPEPYDAEPSPIGRSSYSQKLETKGALVDHPHHEKLALWESLRFSLLQSTTPPLPRLLFHLVN